MTKIRKLDKLKILEFIRYYKRANGYSPSLADIGAEFGTTRNAVSYQCKKMREAGMITYNSAQGRSFVIVDDG